MSQKLVSMFAVYQQINRWSGLLMIGYLSIAGVNRFGLAVRRYDGKQWDLGSNPLRFPFLFKSCGLWTLVFVTLSLTIDKTLKWLSSLPILIQESFWSVTV